MKIKISEIKNIIEYVVIIMFFICSGSVIGLLNPRFFDPLYCGMCFLMLICIGKKLNKTNLYILSFFILLYLLNYLFNRTFAVNRNAYLSYIMRMIGTMCLCSYFKIKDFETKYVNTLTMISGIGTVVFICVYLFGITKFENLNGYPMVGPFNFIKYYEVRNSCIFWEPGAYQFFLLYALIIILNNENWQFSCLKKIQFWILIISLFTTRSTSGYIAFTVLLLWFVYKNWKKMNQTNKVLAIIPILLSLIIGGMWFFGLDVFQKKFSLNNDSYVIRMNDFIFSLDIIKSNFSLIGHGIESDTISHLYDTYKIINNSVGIFTEIITLGIIFVITFVLIMLKRAWNRYYREIVLIFVIIITLFTEDFFFYPIYFIFLFSFKEEDNVLNI